SDNRPVQGQPVDCESSVAADIADGILAVGDTIQPYPSIFVERVVLYKDNGTALTKIAEILSPLPGSRLLFGTALALAQDRLYVGAPAQAVNGEENAGTVYI